LLERTVDLRIDEGHAKVKTLLARKGCALVAEEPPTFISVEQGSVWGVSPRTAKKVVGFRLSPANSKTQIAVTSSLASGWKNLAIMGAAFSAALACLCWWITIDLEAFVATQEPSYWSWITTADGFAAFQVAQTFAALTQALAVFLAVVLALEIILVVFAQHKVDDFADEILNSLC
jgi:hypothetical protein